MKLHLQTDGRLHLIAAYDQHWVRVGERDFHHSLLITPRELVAEHWPDTVANLTAEALAAVGALKPQILLLGTGRTLVRPAHLVLAPLFDAGIGCEVMDTPAACRTYNLLATEGRKVAALLLIEPHATQNRESTE